MKDYADLVKRLREGDLTCINEAADAIADLAWWKADALEVERSWDAQAIANMLGLKPGDDIRAAIQPAIARLSRDLAARTFTPPDYLSPEEMRGAEIALSALRQRLSRAEPGSDPRNVRQQEVREEDVAEAGPEAGEGPV